MLNQPPPQLIVDLNRKTIRPETTEGDTYYGLTPGTNGTATICRRELAFACLTPLNGCSLSELTWTRSDGRPATGITYVPSDRSNENYRNPWTGE